MSLLVTLLIGIAQGPLLRTFLQEELQKQLEAAGFEGSFRIDGSLFSGIEIRDARLTSKGLIRELNIGYLTADYQLMEAIRGNYDKTLTGIRGDGIEVWVDLAAQAKQGEQDELAEQSEEISSDAETSASSINLETIRHYVLPVECFINRSAVRISRGPELIWQASDVSLTHRTGDEQFHLHLGEFTDMDYRSLSHKEATLSWTKRKLEFKNFPIRQDTVLKHVICTWDDSWDPYIPEYIQADITWEGGLFRINLDQVQKARIALNKGTIRLDKLTQWIDGSMDIGGEISRFDLLVEDITASPSHFQSRLNLEAQNLRWQHRNIQQFSSQFNIQNGEAEVKLSTRIDKEEENQLKLKAKLENSPGTPESDDLATAWMNCWHHMSASLELNIPEPDKVAGSASQWNIGETPIQPPPGGWPTGAIVLQANGAIANQEIQQAEARLRYQSPAWSGIKAEHILMDASWHPSTQEAHLELRIPQLLNGKIHASGNYSIANDTYEGKLSLKAVDLGRLQPVLERFDLTIPRAGMVDFTWSGKGKASDLDSYQGSLRANITGLEVEPEGEPATDIQLEGRYEPGLQIEVNQLQVSRGQLSIRTAGEWKDETLKLKNLELHDKDARLVYGSAQVPLMREWSDMEAFLRQPGELKLQLKVDDMPLAEIYEQLPPRTEPLVKGKLSVDFTIGGTLLQPTINLSTKAKRLQLAGRENIPLTDLNLELQTKDQSIQLNGSAVPDGHKPLKLAGNLPFHPKQWIDTPESLNQEPIDLSLDTQSINLAAFAHLMPQISTIEGNFSSVVKLSGTIAEPKLQGDARLRIARVNSTRASIPNLRDIDIRLNYRDNKLNIPPSSCLVAGGKYNLQGNVDFQEIKNPVFDVTLQADKALLWRDDAIIARSDASLKLSGPLEKARLSGDVGIVQSLFYKDIQIIPIGSGANRGASQRAKAELPTFTQANKKKGDRLNIPAPFNEWTLDLTARTKEDFLIRGNIAKGNVKAQVKVTGTLGNPQPKGEIVLQNAQASLPFSRLNVKEGKVFLTPEHGFDPQLSLKATSKIGSYDVEITVYGLASNPKTLMTSRPPLPESEIVLLLATGSTSEQLSDGAAATGKAYQLLVDSVIRSSPSRFRRVMNTIAELNEKVDINIGASDPFTGRKYNSARVEITDRWHVVASIDLDNNTRGMIVYAIQFK